MIMHGIYKSGTLEKLIETMHRMHNTTSLHERLFAGELNHWFGWYLSKDGVGHYAINSVLYLTTIREKYVRIYEQFIEQLKMYARVIRILSKVYLPILLLPPSKLNETFGEVKKALQITNRSYDLVLSHFNSYYNMRLVMFGIDVNRYLIIQFPVFVQPDMQNQLILYQIETVPI